MKFVQACLSAGKVRDCSFNHCRVMLISCRHVYITGKNCGGSMKLVQACLTARRHRESSFHHWDGAVRFVQACLSDSKHRES